MSDVATVEAIELSDGPGCGRVGAVPVGTVTMIYRWNDPRQPNRVALHAYNRTERRSEQEGLECVVYQHERCVGYQGAPGLKGGQA